MMQGSSSLNFVFFSFLNIFLAKRDSENRQKASAQLCESAAFCELTEPTASDKKNTNLILFELHYIFPIKIG